MDAYVCVGCMYGLGCIGMFMVMYEGRREMHGCVWGV